MLYIKFAQYIIPDNDTRYLSRYILLPYYRSSTFAFIEEKYEISLPLDDDVIVSYESRKALSRILVETCSISYQSFCCNHAND